MKAVVLAYHNIGCIGIRALLEAGIEIAAVFTHVDDAKENIWYDSVAELCADKHLPVFTPADINQPEWVEKIRNMAPDVIFSFYYRQIINTYILDIPPKGCINLHGSLLPKYRGRVPINWAVINGEKETGVTLHYMTPRPDDGDIIAQKAFPILADDTAKDVHLKAAKAAGELLADVLPDFMAGKTKRVPQNASEATYFHGRCPVDGVILWEQSATQIRNLIRGVTKPYPGAFSYLNGKKYIIWSASIAAGYPSNVPGTVLSVSPFVIACGDGALQIDRGQIEGGAFLAGDILAKSMHIIPNMCFGSEMTFVSENSRKRILILGVNGFIGSALSHSLLQDGNYEVYGIDMRNNYIQDMMSHPNFHFYHGDIQKHREMVEEYVRICDVVLPLVAIATPIEYTRNPLRVFELDFEENLRIVRLCHHYGKRIIFPSTSEVYAMCDEDCFDEDNSRLILGPIRMQRWIYSCSKQMLDRVIWAYGTKGLKFTLFRPFNWIGPKLDSLQSARIGSSRAITQMILNLVEGQPILLIDGGEQKRCFTHVDDGIKCLVRIIENKNGICDGKIINIGNPDNEASIKELAQMLVNAFEKHPLRNNFPPFAGMKIEKSESYYGTGYQDCQHRRPSIKNAWKYCEWQPEIGFEGAIKDTLDFFLRQASQLKMSEVKE